MNFNSSFSLKKKIIRDIPKGNEVIVIEDKAKAVAMNVKISEAQLEQ